MEEDNPFVRWAKVLFRMVLLLLPEYLGVVLSLGARLASEIPHLRILSIGEGRDNLLALGLAV